MSKLTDEQRQMKWREGNIRYTEAKILAATEPLLQRIAELERRNRDLHEDVQRFKKHALNEKAARLELERQLEEAQKDVKPCPTCESLARAVMLDQTGKA